MTRPSIDVLFSATSQWCCHTVTLIVNSQHEASLAGVGHTVLTILWQTCKLFGSVGLAFAAAKQGPCFSDCIHVHGKQGKALLCNGCRTLSKATVMLCYEWIAEVQQQFGNWESNMACIQNPDYVGLVAV